MSNAPVQARGGGFGLDAELAKKAALKYDYEMEAEAREWIEAITGASIGKEFGPGLRDGIILCQLANAFEPNLIRRIETKSKMPFKLMENVSAFLQACRQMGVSEFNLFETVDLFELKDLGIVVRCIHALGRAVQTTYPDSPHPTLGVKETKKTTRQFSQEKLLEARNVPSLVNLGSLRTMQRIDVSRCNDVTFGADAARNLSRAPPPPPPRMTDEERELEYQELRRQQEERKREREKAKETVTPVSNLNQQSHQPSQVPAKVENKQQPEEEPTKGPESPPKESSFSTQWNVSPASSWAKAAPVAAMKEMTLSPKAVTPEKTTVTESQPSPTRNYIFIEGPDAQSEAQAWIEAVLGEPLEADFGPALKDGVVLCRFINVIKPQIVPKIQVSKMPFKQMENVSSFVRACRKIGVQEYDLFETVDLYELKNINLIVKCLHALGRTIQKTMPQYNGPIIGVKESTANKRVFSEKQLLEARGGISMFAEGSSKVMNRGTIDRSASVTFGADASRKRSLNSQASTGSDTKETSNDSSKTVTKNDVTPAPFTKSNSMMPVRTVWS